MVSDWDQLSDSAQLDVSKRALGIASCTLACQAEALAAEIEAGMLRDRGGPEALRLFASLLRTVTPDPLSPIGRA